MRKIPNLRHLRVFLEVIESKSISQASEAVFLSQPAITQAIAKLEKSLNTDLFDRRSDGMYATASGTIYAERVERALDILRSGLKKAIHHGGADNSDLEKRLQAISNTQLRALIAVFEAENFSLASRNLAVAQSSLHRAARELENLLGIVLFEKTFTGISLSKAGLALVKAAKLAFSEIAQGEDDINSLHQRETGQLVIGSLPLARSSILPETITEFATRYPDFKIKVKDGPYDDLLQHLRHGDIDLLVCALRPELVLKDLAQQALFSSSLVIVARSDHPLFKERNNKPSVETSELCLYPWAVPVLGAPTRCIFESIFESAGIDAPERLVETGSLVLIRSMLLESDQLALLSTHQIELELKLGVLKTVPYSIKDASRSIGLTLRCSWKPTATQLAFVTTLNRWGSKQAP